MKIDSVLFDMGGTLEDIFYDQEIRLNACRELIEYLRGKSIIITDPPEVLWENIYRAYKEYYKIAEATMREPQPFEIWHKWNLRDYNTPEKLMKEISEDLTVIWETKFYRRQWKKEVPQLLETLKNRGYKLGIVSNTSSHTQVYDYLEAFGIRDYFQGVALSSVCTYRKPDPLIFQEGLRLVGSAPESSAFVGDTLSRDIIGAKAAGFGMTIQIKSFLTAEKDAGIEGVAPDFIVPNLTEILNVLV